MTAYGRCFEHRGIREGLRRIASRCLRLYAFQAALLLALLGIVNIWGRYSGFEQPELSRLLSESGTMLRQGLELRALPSYLNILPLYIVLLSFFPVIYAGMRLSPMLTWIASASLWVAANLKPELNLTNWIDGRGWFFNPFAWQFLFVIGAMASFAFAASGDLLPRRPWLAGICWAYLGFALLVSADWPLRAFHPIVMDAPDKTNLSVLRLLNVLALMYLFMSSPRICHLVRSRWAGERRRLRKAFARDLLSRNAVSNCRGSAVQQVRQQLGNTDCDQCHGLECIAGMRESA